MELVNPKLTKVVTTLRNWLEVGIFVGAAILIMWYVDRQEKQRLQQEQMANVARRNIVCPSWFSMADTPHDTLMTMKNEPLCASFLLDSIK
jgi:hypothetical protein